MSHFSIFYIIVGTFWAITSSFYFKRAGKSCKKAGKYILLPVQYQIVNTLRQHLLSNRGKHEFKYIKDGFQTSDPTDGKQSSVTTSMVNIHSSLVLFV